MVQCMIFNGTFPGLASSSSLFLSSAWACWNLSTVAVEGRSNGNVSKSMLFAFITRTKSSIFQVYTHSNSEWIIFVDKCSLINITINGKENSKVKNDEGWKKRLIIWIAFRLLPSKRVIFHLKSCCVALSSYFIRDHVTMGSFPPSNKWWCLKQRKIETLRRFKVEIND